ncbi:MAG: mannose-6-phosphate isomerase, class I [Spirochaetales bacterium]|nr:mannose-6-phosphate isomerase, class I [Spirochaetales bacterium]
MNVYRLKNLTQEYAWGSPVYIPSLLGITNPEGKPKAEMWMGTHPKAPSTVVVEEQGEIPLADLIASDPPAFLGSRVAERFNGELPFLFKLLAAARALSIQAHPNLNQARAGFERENKQGIPLDAPDRSYRDPNHKPEVICALTSFWAMCGFRPLGEIVGNLAFLEDTALDKQYAELKKKPGAKALRRFFGSLLTLDHDTAAEIVDIAAKTAPAVNDEAGMWVSRLKEQRPGDIGAISPLLLNTYRLEPGQAIFLDAGELHSYLEGFAVELMANSDNVLRGGLTEKHVDADELLRILTFKTERVPVFEGRETASGLRVFQTQAEEFRLSRISVLPESPYREQGERNVEILIVTGGACSLRCGTGDGLELAGGESVFVPAAAGAYEITGAATVFRATVP